MRYEKIDNTGLIVSKIAFGAMTSGEGVLVEQRLKRLEETARVVETAARNGWIRYPGVPNFPAWRQPMGDDLLASEDCM